MTSAYTHTPFTRKGRESVVRSSREGLCYTFLTGNVQPAFFLVGNHARNGVSIVVAFKNLVTLGTCFQVFHSDEQRDKEQERAREKRS